MCPLRLDPTSTVLALARGLPPALHFRPELGKGAEFRTLAKEDVDLFFQSVGVLSGRAHILHVFPEAFENLSAVVKDDHAVSGVATRAPEEPGLVAAEGRREAVAAAEEIDGAGLAVVLGEDAAIVALVDGDAIPSDSSFVSDLFPAELVGVPLRQCGPGVGVFHDRELEGEIFCVGEKAVRGKNRHHHRGKVCAAGQQGECNGRFQPLAAGAGILATINRGLNRDGSGRQQHGINRS